MKEQEDRTFPSERLISGTSYLNATQEALLQTGLFIVLRLQEDTFPALASVGTSD